MNRRDPDFIIVMAFLGLCGLILLTMALWPIFGVCGA